MNKNELVRRVGRRADATQADSLIFIDAFIDVVKDAIRDGEEILVSGFGTFGCSLRKEHEGTHPQNKNIKIIVPEQKVPTFKPSPIFREYINEED